MVIGDWWVFFLAARKRWVNDWRRFATRLTGRAEDAEDLVSEAILRIIAAEPEIDSARGFHRFTLKTIKNLFLNQQRRRRLRRELIEKLTRDESVKTSFLLQKLDDPGDAIDKHAVVDAALRHVRKLPAHLREAITLYFLADDGGTYRDIGEALKVSTSTAHGYVQDALARLRQALRDEFNL